LVWQDEEVGNFVNEKFIPLRITPSDKGYRQTRADYKVRGTPTVLLLNPQGEEIDRTIGFDGKRDAYFQTIQDLSQGKDTLLSLMAKLEENSDNVEANFKIGKRYIDRHEWENVQPHFAKVLEKDPEDEKGFKSESTYNLAVFELRINSKIEPLQNFIANSADKEILHKAYTNLVAHFIRTKKLDSASELYEEAMEKLTDNAALMTDYAMFVFTSQVEDKYERGIELAKKAMVLAPDDEEVLFSSYYCLISYYKNMKDKEKYFGIYEVALQKLPKNTFFHYGYAEAILNSKAKDKFDRGIEVAEKALDLEPKAAHLWYSLGRLYFEKGNLEKAVESVQKALEIVPNSKQYRKTLKKFERENKN
jgi:tetratricopeptide (TPR) repeat protein